MRNVLSSYWAVVFLGLALPATPANALSIERGVAFDSADEPIRSGFGDLPINLPGGRTLTFSLTSYNPEPGMRAFRGVSPSNDRLYMFESASRLLTGDIYAHGGRFRLVEAEGRHFWTAVEHGSAPAATDIPCLATTEKSTPQAPRLAETAAPGADGNYQIDLLVLYTSQLQKEVGDVRAYAQRLVFLANAFLQNSKVPVRFNITDVSQNGGTDEDVGFYDNLDHIASNPEVAKLRNRQGADLVVLFRSQRGANPDGISGLARAFNDGEQSDPPANVNAERDAFTVVANDGYVHTLAHELGHLLGGGHAYVKDAGLAKYWKTYAHGWACGDAGGGLPYLSILYGVNIDISSDDELDSMTGDFFSNPQLLQDGQLCGQDGVPGTEITEANNARSMTEAAPYVAAYRNRGSAESAGMGLGRFGVGLLFPSVILIALRRLGFRPRGLQ
ncbi:MAG: hypothetical protein HYV18_06725 [Gammaproteobacteria bacterium]|nr:hypothetical protein [Gammaproteobacteria bacterium]